MGLIFWNIFDILGYILLCSFHHSHAVTRQHSRLQEDFFDRRSSSLLRAFIISKSATRGGARKGIECSCEFPTKFAQYCAITYKGWQNADRKWQNTRVAYTRKNISHEWTGLLTNRPWTGLLTCMKRTVESTGLNSALAAVLCRPVESTRLNSDDWSTPL